MCPKPEHTVATRRMPRGAPIERLFHVSHQPWSDCLELLQEDIIYGNAGNTRFIVAGNSKKNSVKLQPLQHSDQDTPINTRFRKGLSHRENCSGAVYQVLLYSSYFTGRFGLRGNQPLRTRSFCSKSSLIVHNDEKANTPASAATSTLSVQSDQTIPPMPNNRKIHQHPVPQ